MSFFYFLVSSPFFIHMQRFSPQPVCCLSFHILPVFFFFFNRAEVFQFNSVTQSCLTLCDPWTAACQAPLSIISSRSLLKLISIVLVCHPTISSSVVPFFSSLQSFPASGSFQMSQVFTSGGQSVGVSASTSVFPMNSGLISLQSNVLSRVFFNTTEVFYSN